MLEGLEIDLYSVGHGRPAFIAQSASRRLHFAGEQEFHHLALARREVG